MTDPALRAIIDAEWPVRLSVLGTLDVEGTPAGPDRYRLPTVDPEVRQRAAAAWTTALSDLDALDLGTLTADDRIDASVLRFQIETQLDRVRFELHHWMANSDTTFWTDLTQRTPARFESVADAEAFTGMLTQIPQYIEGSVADLRAGLDRGFAPFRTSMVGRDHTAAVVAEAADAAGTPFLAPYLVLDGSAGAEARDRAIAVIENDVIPAFALLHRFVAEVYLPALPTSPAAYDLPDGAAFYAAQLREYTTTEWDAEQIHRTGLAEVAALRAEMAVIAGDLGYSGDTAVDDLLEFMRTDEQFFARTEEQLLHLAAWECKRFDDIAHHWFGRMPRRRFGVAPPPPELAPNYTAGRGGPGRYTVNTYNLAARPLHSIPALTLHEAAPGHAFQIPFAEELDLADFRRLVYLSAYGEGWGLYCERLGDEMGTYVTPYQRMGMLSFQMWRAVRLVIDPGIHAFGWSRDRAIEYLATNTAMSEHDVRTEVDRYITWPGQATAYYLGMLEIQRLRRLATDRLGSAFDIRAFHDCVLSTGSVPLSVLAERIEIFIADGGRSPFTS